MDFVNQVRWLQEEIHPRFVVSIIRLEEYPLGVQNGFEVGGIAVQTTAIGIGCFLSVSLLNTKSPYPSAEAWSM